MLLNSMDSCAILLHRQQHRLTHSHALGTGLYLHAHGTRFYLHAYVTRLYLHAHGRGGGGRERVSSVSIQRLLPTLTLEMTASANCSYC